MNIKIKQMNGLAARLICRWTYEEPYSIYNLSEDEECINELLNGDYFAAYIDQDELVGFFCYGNSAQVPCGDSSPAYENGEFVDIGLGMKPSLTGSGFGTEFVMEGIEHGSRIFQNKRFRLTVAAFNKRAIKVYERLGFKESTRFSIKRFSGDMEFIVMLCK